MQDWLGLDSDCRMNIPSRPEENWTWRLEKYAFEPELSARIRELVEVTDRDPLAHPPVQRLAEEEFAA
jgi:4-alpha-glucanotransferase